MPPTPSSPSSPRSPDLERTWSKGSGARHDWRKPTTGTATPRHAADRRLMSRQSSRSADGLNRSTDTPNTDYRGQPFSRSPSALKKSPGPQQPRYLLSTASARNRVQFNVARPGNANRDRPNRDGGVNSPSASRSPGGSTNYNRPRKEGIASRSGARPFRSRRGSDRDDGNPKNRYRRWEGAAALAAHPRSGSSSRYVRTQSDYEAEIERLRESLHKEIRAKDKLRFELRRALDPDSDDTELSDCRISRASSPPRSFWSIPSLTRSRGSPRWPASPGWHGRHDFYGSRRSLPLTPREFWRPNRHLGDPELSRSRWYAVDSPSDYGRRALYGYGSQSPQYGYKPRVRYYYDDDDEDVLRKLRRERARQRYDGEGCSRVQVRIRWPWLCFRGGHFHRSRRREFEELRQDNRKLSAQLQRLEEGQILKQGLEIGAGSEEEVDLPRLEAAAIPTSTAAESRVEEPLSVPVESQAVENPTA